MYGTFTRNAGRSLSAAALLLLGFTTTTIRAQAPPTQFRCSNGFVAPSTSPDYRVSGRINGCENYEYVLSLELVYQISTIHLRTEQLRVVQLRSDEPYSLSFNWCDDIARFLPSASTNYIVYLRVTNPYLDERIYEQRLSLAFTTIRGNIDLPLEHCGDLVQAARLYATQAVDTEGRDVVLVEDKQTVVRLVPTVTRDFGLETPTGLLYGYRNGVELPGSPLSPHGRDTVRIDADAELNEAARDANELLTLNFLLPVSWTTAGTISLQGVLDPENELGECEECWENNHLDTQATFERGGELIIQPYWVLIGDEVSPLTDEEKQAEIEEALSGTKELFPYQRLTIKPFRDHRVSTSANINDVKEDMQCKACGWFDLLCSSTIHVGFVDHTELKPYDGENPQGIANLDIPGVASNFAPLVVAHEIGHALNRKHAPSATAENPDSNYPYPLGRLARNGFNVYQMETIPLRPSDTNWARDIMAYGDPRWISDYTWNALFDHGFSRALPSSDSQREDGAAAVVAGTTRVAFVRGLMGPAGAQIRWAWVQDVPSVLLSPADSGQLEVRAMGVQNTVLARRSFTPPENPVSADGLQPIEAYVEFPEGATGIELYDTIELRPLARRNISLSPPVVTVFSPAGDVTYEPDDMLTLEWSASDADGDPVRTWIQFSADGGKTWENLGFDIVGSSFEVPVNWLRGTTQGRIRFAVSDGLRTTTVAASANLTVPDMPPSAYILQAPELTVAQGDLVRLSGSASDREDDGFPEDALVWTSDRGGFLGTGSSLELQNADVGEHVVELTVTDSAGQTARAEVVVIVVGPTASGEHVPGDANRDGIVDLSDPINVLNTLFLSAANGFPCGDGTATHPGNVQLLDWNGDEALDLSDAVASLSFLFIGGLPHELGSDCVAIAGCANGPCGS